MNIEQFKEKRNRNLYTRIDIQEINYLDKHLKENTYLVVETLECIYSSYYKLIDSARNASSNAELYISIFGVLLSLNGDFNGHINTKTKVDFPVHEMNLDDDMSNHLC